MRETALVIMAAGIGSRFGQGIKQLAAVGPNGEIIMDYSIHDAMEAGFNKVVFIIRKDIEAVFKEVIGNRIEKIIPVSYVFQAMDDIPAGFSVPEGRVKPWGTGQAVLTAKKAVDCPFLVINADDYYGKEAFKKIHEFLVADRADNGKKQYCMAGFILGNTLSENGAVTRGVCTVDDSNHLVDVVETPGLIRKDNLTVLADRNGSIIDLAADRYVSMNMWGFTPDIFDELESRFSTFLQGIDETNSKKAEFLLPSIVDELLKLDQAEVTVLETRDKWFGVTYADDKKLVVEAFKKLYEQGVYNSKLFG
ncbi:MAG: nucleotidyltransferase [Lachnospiraceae bacterium]|nr:nucleotidyltransferase [Lachnospiraceae bacterium]